jgi:hypothetical protein
MPDFGEHIEGFLVNNKWYIVIGFIVLVFLVIYMMIPKSEKRNYDKPKFIGINPENHKLSPFSYGRKPYYGDKILNTDFVSKEEYNPHRDLEKGMVYNQKEYKEESEDYSITEPPKFRNKTPWYKLPRNKISKGEMACLEALYNIFGDDYEFKSVRPSWLKNPKTNRAMELDCYNEKLKLAVEYQGEQHYKFPNIFHKSKNDFDAQVYRDETKLDICDELGVYVITVPYTIKNEDIEKYIIYYLPENRQNRVDQNLTN